MEVDTDLHVLNRAAHEVVRAALEQRRTARVVRDTPMREWRLKATHELAKATGRLNRALDHYERLEDECR